MLNSLGSVAEQTGLPESTHRLANAPSGKSPRQRSALGAAERPTCRGTPQACSNMASMPTVRGPEPTVIDSKAHRNQTMAVTRQQLSVVVLLQHHANGYCGVAALTS